MSRQHLIALARTYGGWIAYYEEAVKNQGANPRLAWECFLEAHTTAGARVVH